MMFRTIMTFELKILFKSTGMKVAILLNCIVLIVFIAMNMIALRDIKANDISRFELALVDNIFAINAYSDNISFMEKWVEDNPDRAGLSDELVIEVYTWNYEAHSELSTTLVQLIEALREGEYTAAFEHLHAINSAGVEYYRFMSQPQYSDEFAHLLVAMGRNISDRYYNQYNFTGYLLENQIPFLYENDMKPFNFMYQLFHKLLPLYFFFIAAIAIFPVLSKEAGSGALVFTLSKPSSRIKILFAKYCAALQAVLIAVFVPILLAAVLLGLINGFDSPGYPVLTQRNAFISYDPLHNDQSKNEWYYQTPLGIRMTGIDPLYITPEALASAFTYMPGRLGVSSYNLFREGEVTVDHKLDDRIGFISISRFLLLTVPLWVASAMFFTAIVFLLALLIRKEIFVLFFLLAVAAANLIFSRPVVDLSFYERLNPLLSTNAGQILSAMGGVTALNAVCTSMAIAALSIGICVVLFRRLEIK